MGIANKKPTFPRPSGGPFVFMKWIFLEADVLGIHPFSRHLTFTGAKAFRTTVSLLIVASLFLTMIKHFIDTFKAGPSMSKVVGFLNVTTFTIIGFPVITGHIKNSIYLKKCLEKIARIDDRFWSVFSIKYKYDSRRMTRNMICWNAYRIFLYITFKAFSKKGFTLFESINTAVRFYFVFTMYNCSRQFVALGTVIVGHFKILKSHIRLNRASLEPNKLDAICLLHCELVDCCYLSMKWFNQRFFLIATCYFLGFMYNFCLILADVRSIVEENEFVDNIVYYSAWQVIEVYQLWRVLATCSAIEDEVTVFYEEITYVAANQNPQIWHISSGILEVFLAKKPDVQYWGSGFFRLDNSLLHSIAATLTTCYVIIVQYMTSYTNSQSK